MRTWFNIVFERIDSLHVAQLDFCGIVTSFQQVLASVRELFTFYTQTLGLTIAWAQVMRNASSFLGQNFPRFSGYSHRTYQFVLHFVTSNVQQQAPYISFRCLTIAVDQVSIVSFERHTRWGNMLRLLMGHVYPRNVPVRLP